MKYTLSAVLMIMIASDNINIHGHETKEKSLESPADKMKEVAMISTAYTVICENTMVIHIFNTSITTTTMIYPGMSTFKSTLEARR